MSLTMTPVLVGDEVNELWQSIAHSAQQIQHTDKKYVEYSYSHIVKCCSLLHRLLDTQQELQSMSLKIK